MALIPSDNRTRGGDNSPMSEEKAAEKIQASFRGYKTRKTLKDNGVVPAKEDKNQSNGEVDEKTEELPEHPEEKSTVKPSSAQSTLDDELADIDLTDADLAKAAAKIQASYRNFTKKKKVPEPTPPSPPEVSNEKENTADENLEDIDLEDPEVEKAALKIQSTFRGYKVRKEVKDDVSQMTNGEKGDDEE